MTLPRFPEHAKYRHGPMGLLSATAVLGAQLSRDAHACRHGFGALDRRPRASLNFPKRRASCGNLPETEVYRERPRTRARKGPARRRTASPGTSAFTDWGWGWGLSLRSLAAPGASQLSPAGDSVSVAGTNGPGRDDARVPSASSSLRSVTLLAGKPCGVHGHLRMAVTVASHAHAPT